MTVAVPYSTHSRGVPLWDRSLLLDAPRHIARILLTLRDTLSSGFWALSTQSWCSLTSVIIAVLSVTFFHFFFPSDTLAADLQWSPICFSVVLPCVVFGALSWLRREAALSLFSELKASSLSLHALYHDWADCDPGESVVTLALRRVCDSLIVYLTPPRFTSVFFPYRGTRPVMARLAEARERHAAATATAARALHAAVTDLRAPPASLGPALEVALHAKVDAIFLAVEKLGDIKEYRTPLAVRAVGRVYLTLLEPIFWGSYGAWVATQANYGFAFFFTAVSQLAIVSTLNLLLAFEDPFDNSGMDLVYVPERIGEILRELERAQDAWKGDAEGSARGALGAAANAGNAALAAPGARMPAPSMPLPMPLPVTAGAQAYPGGRGGAGGPAPGSATTANAMNATATTALLSGGGGGGGGGGAPASTPNPIHAAAGAGGPPGARGGGARGTGAAGV